MKKGSARMPVRVPAAATPHHHTPSLGIAMGPVTVSTMSAAAKSTVKTAVGAITVSFMSPVWQQIVYSPVCPGDIH